MRALADDGVRTPAVVPARDGSLVVSVSIPATDESRLVDVQEWIDGRQPGDDEIVECFGVLGDLHARCHNHASRWRIPPGFVRQRWDETTLLAGVHPTVGAAWDNWALSNEQRALVLAEPSRHAAIRLGPRTSCLTPSQHRRGAPRFLARVGRA
jgi:Ser/Thr protein kinase RdoA (MazF antagonist)